MVSQYPYVCLTEPLSCVNVLFALVFFLALVFLFSSVMLKWLGGGGQQNAYMITANGTQLNLADLGREDIHSDNTSFGQNSLL